MTLVSLDIEPEASTRRRVMTLKKQKQVHAYWGLSLPSYAMGSPKTYYKQVLMRLACLEEECVITGGHVKKWNILCGLYKNWETYVLIEKME